MSKTRFVYLHVDKCIVKNFSVGNAAGLKCHLQFEFGTVSTQSSKAMLTVVLLALSNSNSNVVEYHVHIEYQPDPYIFSEIIYNFRVGENIVK